MSLLRNRFFRSASASLLGHMVLFEIFCGGPLALVFAYLSYIDGNRTLERLIQIAIVCTVFAFVMALLLWFSVTRRLNKRQNQAGTAIGQ